MRDTSALYKTLRTEPGSWYEVQIVRGQTQYGPDVLKSCSISSSLFPGDGPQIGGTVASHCKVVLVEQAKNWPRMAQFQIRVRLCSDDNTQKSEWLPMGTYYTDERSEDKYGNLTIVGYDGMLTLEQSWTDKISELPSEWPITAYAAAKLMVEASGVQVDSRSYLDDTVPFIGLDTTSTVRDVYKTIAAAMGGNWQMTPEGKLLLVRLESSTEDVFSGNNGVYELYLTDHNGNAITDENQDEIVVGSGSYLGLSVMSLDLGQPLPPVTGVSLEGDGGGTATAGTSTGYVIKGKCVYSDSRAADLCLSRLSGFVYRPFEAGGALLDPAAETGDMVALDGVNYQIVNINWNIGPFITCELSSPLETEVDHEYTVQTEAAKSLQKALAADNELEERTNSYILQTAERIEQGVSREYATKTELSETSANLSSQITQTAESITSTVNEQISNLQDQIDGVIETWSGSEVPTISNYPASEWTTDTDKDNHIGDLYVVDNSGGDYAGFYYRFEKEQDGTYAWALLEDSALTKAMAAATEALEKATATEQNLARNYSTTIDMNSAISQSADSITQTVSQTYSTKTEAQGYANAAESNAAADATSKANAAVTSANNYTNTALQGYSTTSQMNSAISQSADGIKQTVSETYATKAELTEATDGTAILQTPYAYSNGSCTFNAKVYRNGDDVTSEYGDNQFEWWINTESTSGPERYSDGKTLTVDSSIMGYGGVVICRLYTKGDEASLITHTGIAITDHDGNAITAVPVKAVMEVQTALYQPETIEKKFAEVSIETEEVKTEVTNYVNTTLGDYSTTEQMNAAIRTAADEINLAVSKTYATQGAVAEAKNATITGETIHYLATSMSSGVTINTAGWTTEPQSVTSSNRYLWTYSTYTYGSGNTQNTSPVISGVYGDTGSKGDQGEKGDKGNTGTGISTVTPLYYSSSSASAPAGPTAAVTRTDTVSGAWTRGIPSLTSTYKYLYTCDQVAYDDGTYKWTTVVADNAMNDLSNRMTSAELKITDSAIVSTVTSSSDWNTLSTTVTQTANGLSSKVDNGSVISAINQSAESVSINANKINLSGYVEFSDLSTAGGATIVGNNITAGKIASKNGKVYFDLDNNEIAVSKLTSVESSATDDYSTSFVLGTPTTTSLNAEANLFVDGYESNALTFSATTDANAGIRSPHSLRIQGGSSVNIWGGSATVSGDGSTIIDGSVILQSSYAQLVVRTRRPEMTGYSGGFIFQGDVRISNGLTVTGTKSRLAHTENYADRLLYCYEMPSPMFGDIGEATLDEAGECMVDLDDIFTETIAEGIEYQVFLQKEGSGDAWIEAKERRYFLIRGTPGLRVAWEVKAKQRDYECERLEPPDEDDAILPLDHVYDDELDNLITEQEEILYEAA